MKQARWNERKRLCAGCGARPARFRYNGQVKRDRSHVLCFQCYRAIRDSQRLAPHPSFELASRPAGRPRGARTGTAD